MVSVGAPPRAAQRSPHCTPTLRSKRVWGRERGGAERMQVVAEREGEADELVFLDAAASLTVGDVRREVTRQLECTEGAPGTWEIWTDGELAADDAAEVDVLGGARCRAVLQPCARHVARQRLLQGGVRCVDEHTLAAAARSGDVDSVRLILQAQLLDEKVHGKALVAACTEGAASVVEALLEEGVSANGHADGAAVPLIWAARKGRQGICELLLDAGAEVNAKNEDGATPLIMAATYAHEDVCRMLLARGADPGTLQIFGWTVGWKGEL
eukprot:TRINITY_DN9224_c0_g1_i1.p1 TRINITY_DN9224_c0_g1~~TRINITY_DN9224_c0_g1_i1.p1  ORF type:complete len:270 (+),score=73.74 TRINITY_DN9224_c0_g1_i1:1460-2269(+)